MNVRWTTRPWASRTGPRRRGVAPTTTRTNPRACFGSGRSCRQRDHTKTTPGWSTSRSAGNTRCDRRGQGGCSISNRSSRVNRRFLGDWVRRPCRRVAPPGAHRGMLGICIAAAEASWCGGGWREGIADGPSTSPTHARVRAIARGTAAGADDKVNALAGARRAFAVWTTCSISSQGYPTHAANLPCDDPELRSDPPAHFRPSWRAR